MDPRTLQALRSLSVLHAPPGKPFILKSGKESMTYVDVRLTALNAEGLSLLADEIIWHVLEVRDGATTVAGVALGGCPLATGVSLLSLELSKEADEKLVQTLTDGRDKSVPVMNAVYVRPEAKDHGTGKLVEGGFTPGDGVVLIEDVITSGGSSLKAISALRDAGLVVKGVIAVLDREEGGRAKIEGEGVPLRSLCTLSELLAT